MKLCKICSGEIKTPEGESVLSVCTDCLKRDDLSGMDENIRVRAKGIKKDNPHVTAYKATNVPEPVKPEPEPEPDPGVDITPKKKAAKKKAAKKKVAKKGKK